MAAAREIARKEEERIKLIEDKLSKFPNLEEDPEFLMADKDFGDGARVIAIRRVSRAKSPIEFPKAELSYYDLSLVRQVVYVIGRGKMNSPNQKGIRDSLFYLNRWNEVQELRDRNIGRTAFEDIISLDLLEQR